MILMIIVGVLVVGVIWGACLMWGPEYGVYVAQKEGEAELTKAHNEQKIQVTRAQSRFDAAELNKKAAVIEAEAVAEQIKRIGENLQKHDLYLKWQWIKMMEERPDSSVIYVPTEASLPILESQRLKM